MSYGLCGILPQEFAELLINKGAHGGYRDAAGATVLIHAAHANMGKVVKALLDAPADKSGVEKDAASDEGVTALIAASMKVGKSKCRLLCASRIVL